MAPLTLVEYTIMTLKNKFTYSEIEFRIGILKQAQFKY